MGLFKSKEERRQEKERREREAQEMRLRIERSEVTQMLKIWFFREFSNLDGERVRKLRTGYFYRLDMDRSGFILSLCEHRGNAVSKEGATFAELGYDYLPSGMDNYLRSIISGTLKEIPYLRIIDDPSFTLITAGNNIKSSW